MKTVTKVLAALALGLTVVPPLLFLSQSLAEEPMKHLMLAGCVLWFAASPFALKGGAE